ncbi:unnamed protein product, partial [Polarella glacialis]
ANVYRIVAGLPLANGDSTWQAEILIPHAGGPVNHVGRPRTMCIRGPSRPDQDLAEQDGRELEDAAKDGVKAVRQAADKQQKTKKGRA